MIERGGDKYHLVVCSPDNKRDETILLSLIKKHTLAFESVKMLLAKVIFIQKELVFAEVKLFFCMFDSFLNQSMKQKNHNFEDVSWKNAPVG